MWEPFCSWAATELPQFQLRRFSHNIIMAFPNWQGLHCTDLGQKVHGHLVAHLRGIIGRDPTSQTPGEFCSSITLWIFLHASDKFMFSTTLQNLGEAEYVVALFMYMCLLGYPAEKISILTTYNGQKHLIRDIINQRCGNNPMIGRPNKVTFQILSTFSFFSTNIINI